MNGEKIWELIFRTTSRNGPGYNFKKLEELERGLRVPQKGISSDGLWLHYCTDRNGLMYWLPIKESENGRINLKEYIPDTTKDSKQWVVLNSTIVYSQPNYNAGKVYEHKSGDKINEIDREIINSKLWIKTQRGWVPTVNKNGLPVLKQLPPSSTKDTTDDNNFSIDSSNSNNLTEGTVNSSSSTILNTEKTTSGYMPEDWFTSHMSSAGNYDQYDYDGTIKNIRAIHGVPYQFLPNADIRLSSDGSALGRTYASKIVSKMPIMFITPGRPAFMTNYSKEDQKKVLGKLIGSLSGLDSSLEGLLAKNGRYYTLQFDHVRYFNYVNPMCRIASQFLGIGDTRIDGVPLKNYNWGDGSDVGVARSPSFLKPKLQSFFNTGLPGCLAFYINSDTSISETFSNNTTESQMASKANSMSDTGRELNFLLGYTTAGLGLDWDVFQDTDVAQSVEDINKLMDGILGGNNFIMNLTSHLSTVAKGGKLTFPEIWSDSSFSRSYDINIKLVSPDPDKLSVYLNVLVPLLHLVGLVAPQSIDANPNGYMSPFLVRAAYKGIFNVDMGIITSMSVTKGTEGGWTKEGIPTVVDVNLTIKDLYEAMSITDMMGKSQYDTMNNTAQMDYIANLCGINIFKPEISRQIEMWFAQNIPNKAADTLYNVFGKVEQNILDKAMRLYTNSLFK